MFPVLLKLGPLSLHTYGLMVALGFLAAYTVARQRVLRAGLPISYFDNLALSMMFGGLLGARLLYFILDPNTRFGEDPLAFFRIWEGGLVYYGGFLGALVAAIVISKIKQIPFLLITDAFSAPLLIGQALGRLGCFAAGCCYGRPSSGWLGVTYSRPDSLAPLGVRVHPTQLYESAGALILLGLLLLWEKPRAVRGDSTAFYLLGYGVLRFFVETFRGDDRGPMEMGFSPSQILSLLTVISGLILWIYARQRRPN